MLGFQQSQFLIFFGGWTILVYLIYRMVIGYYRNQYIEVTAKVTGIESYMSRGRRGGRIEVFNPQFTYNWNGWQRTMRPRAYASYWRYKIGDEVTLYIHPEDTEKVFYPDLCRKLFYTLWFFGAFAILVRIK